MSTSTSTTNCNNNNNITHETPWYLVKNGPSHQSTTDHNHILHLDGRTGEGGGQLLRNAIAYATLMTTTQHQHRPALSITHIRAHRSKPGLQAQHVASLQLPVEIMHAAVEKKSTGTSSTSTVSSSSLLTGDHVGSLEIQYQPPNESSTSSIRQNDETTHDSPSVSSSLPWIVEKDIGTAGSICLLLQASLPCALFASRRRRHHHHQSPSTILQLNLHGGTNATMAPQYDYWQYVFWPILQHHCQLSPHQIVGTVLRRGYYPRGGGHVQVTVQPLQPHQSLAPIRLTERGTNIQSLYIRAFHAGKLKRHLATQMAQAAQAYLKALGQGEFAFWKDDDDDDDDNDNNNNLLVDIVTETNAVGNGLGILMVATTDTGCKLAGSALSSPGQKAADVGRAAAKELVTAWKAGGCVDEWLQDQLIIFMALAQGESRMLTGCLTMHTQTAIWTAQQLCPGVHFQVQKLDNDENQEDDDDKDKDRSLAKPASKKQKGASYGQKGLIPGRHLIICQGIGLRPPPR